MMPTNTNSPGNRRELPPPLAQYFDLSGYRPSYGDFVVWSGWFTTWHGVVTNYDPETDELYIIFSTVPFILFTMNDDEQTKETQRIKLSQIKSASHGTYAIQQHDYTRNTNIWYL